MKRCYTCNAELSGAWTSVGGRDFCSLECERLKGTRQVPPSTSGTVLQRIIIERQADGRYRMRREMSSGNGDLWYCDDLLDAFEIVSAAFRPDGSMRTSVDRESVDADGPHPLPEVSS